MKRILSVLFVLAILSISLLPTLVVAADPEYTVYSSPAYDGYTWYTDNVYSDVRYSTVGNVAQESTSCMVGQEIVWGNYTIGRMALVFDTSMLDSTDNIQSMHLYFWVRADGSTDEFSITAVDTSAVGTTMQTTDYYVMGESRVTFGTRTTAGISTTAYSNISLSASALNHVNKDGYTKFGLMSAADINHIAPADHEYVWIYSAESTEHAPYLSITYIDGSLGVPLEMKIDEVGVVTGYKEAGDELFVWHNILRYNETPQQASNLYFAVQLLASDNTVLAQVPVNEWGYAPLSIYLSDNQVVTAGLAWNDDFKLKLLGTVMFGSPTGYTPYIYESTGDEWLGFSNIMLDSWVKSSVSWLEDVNGVADGTYGANNAVGGWSVNPDQKAQYLLVEGIPYIDIARPALFQTTTGTLQEDADIDKSWSDDIFGTMMGTYWSGAFNDLAGGWGLGGQIAFGLLMSMPVLAIGAVVRNKTNDSTLSLIVMMAAAVLLVLVPGGFAMDVTILITVGVLGLLLQRLVVGNT